jgi:hypothetical protein
MNWIVLSRLTLWTMPLVTCAALAGCAALDLLGGHIPGGEEDPPLLVEPRPYPGATATSSQRPSLGETASQPDAETAPAPIVSAAAKSQLGSAPADPSPARATVTDGSSASAAQKPQPPPTQPLTAQPPDRPAADKPEPAAAGTPPAAAGAPPAVVVPETSTRAKVETEASPPPAEAATKTTETTRQDPPAKAEPTPEQRLAEVLRRRDDLVSTLETEVKLRSGKPDPEGELPRMQRQLRLWYLLAEKPDAAVSEVESLPEAEQEAFRQLMFGLSTWMSPEEERRANLRNARVLRSLREAAAQLSAAAKLDVHNLRFCESVEGYGWYKEFPTAQFRSKQQVILYAEVDNFATEQTGPDSYETELQASYQIFDSGGTLVDERQLPLDKEVCRNQRRDYFLAYRIYLPEGLAAGRYRLELTVEDLKAKQHYQGRKLGDGMTEFSIR